MTQYTGPQNTQGGFAPQHQNNMAQQQTGYSHQNQNNQPIDKGYIKSIIGEYHKKQNGQLLYKQGTNEPVMGKKYMTIGEVIKWPSQGGGYYEDVEFYPGFTVLDMNKKARIFWDSQNQQPAQNQPYR